MNADRVLTETFTAHEHLAPDPGETWAGIAGRLEPRRSRGTLAMVGAAAAVVALAVGGTVLLGDRDPAPVPAPPATSPERLQTVGISAGWLPPGAVASCVETGAIPTRCYRAGTLSIWLSLEPDGTLSESLPRTTVGGRPGRTVGNGIGNYRLDFLVPGRGVAKVSLEDEGKPDAVLAPIALRIAESMRFDRADPVQADFVLTYLPPALFVSKLVHGKDDVDGLFATTWYTVSTGSLQQPRPAVMVSDVNGTLKTQPNAYRTIPAVRGRPVQGHPSWEVRTARDTFLWVDDFWPGRSLLLHVGGTVSFPDLYRIAEGVRKT